MSLFILLVVVTVHEFGHFWFMRRNGVRIAEFSIGVGTPIAQWRIKDPHEPKGSDQGGTIISLRLLPIGGYVAPVESKKNPVQSETQLGIAEWEKSAGRWARFKIYMAGMLFNSIAAFIVLAVLFYATGKVPVIPLEWTKWAPSLLRPLVCAFLGSFGIWLATPALIVIMAAKLGASFFSQTAGPLGIVVMGNKMMGGSATPADMAFNVVFFFAMINGAIAGFNLLPLFPLDGGRVAAMVIEMMAGRPNTTAERWFKIGTGLLIAAFAIFVIGHDFFKAALSIFRA